MNFEMNWFSIGDVFLNYFFFSTLVVIKRRRCSFRWCILTDAFRRLTETELDSVLLIDCLCLNINRIKYANEVVVVDDARLFAISFLFHFFDIQIICFFWTLSLSISLSRSLTFSISCIQTLIEVMWLCCCGTSPV